MVNIHGRMEKNIRDFMKRDKEMEKENITLAKTGILKVSG